MNRVAIISNAGSGRNRSRSQLLRQLDAVSGVDQVVTASAQEIPDALERLLEPGPAVLAVNGGDGTVQAVLTALATLRRDRAIDLPPLAMLPAGSTNMTAHDLDCGGRLSRRVGDLLALRDRPRDQWRLQRRRPLSVRTPDGEVRIGFCFGLGTIVRGIEFWHERLHHGGGAGEWGAGAAFLRAAWGLVRRHPPFDVSTEMALTSESLARERAPTSFALVTSMERLFLGFTPFWNLAGRPLKVTWIDPGAERFMARLPSFVRGRGDRLPPEAGYHAGDCDALTLAFDDTWALDGELFPAPGSLTIEAGDALECVRLTDDLAP